MVSNPAVPVTVHLLYPYFTSQVFKQVLDFKSSGSCSLKATGNPPSPKEASTMTTPTPTAPSPQASGQRPTAAELGKVLLRRLIEEVINRGRLEVTDELFSPQLAAAARHGFTAFRAAFSDWHMELVDLVAEDDKVVGRFRCSGTHTGPWLGIAPTGRRFEQVDEVATLRIQDGRFVDYWALEDTAGRLRQLGINSSH
jgi:predicted ester cyclase